MTEPHASNAISSTASSRRGTGVLALAAASLALIAALIALGWLWRVERRSGSLEQERADFAVSQRLVEERLQQVEAELRSAQQRLQDAAAINRNLRDEMLGVAERADLVEQALKRVSDRGMENVTELRMNNAEFLLGAGLARLRLFHDTAGAATALSLADAELAVLQDPVVTGIRQSLARELAALSGFPADARAAAQARLQRIAERADELHLRRDSAPVQVSSDRPTWGSRARRLFGEFVRVRRVATGSGAGSAISDEIARVDLRLQIRYAEAALMETDSARFKAQLARIAAALQSFDLDSEVGRWLRSEIESLGDLPDFPEFTEAGGALDQLRNLQNARHLVQPFGGVE
jgi:uroporphyrin-3 C-methyltransferase